MNIASRTRCFFAAAMFFLGTMASVHAQQNITVNNAACSAATVTFGAGTISITTPTNCAAAQPPTISGLSLPSGGTGTPLTITGSNLIGASVTIGGATAIVTSNNGTQALTSVPAGAAVGAGNVVVTTSAGTASSAFTVISCPTVAPVISGLSVPNGLPGAALTISGTNMLCATVTIGTKPATVTSNTGTLIVTAVPGDATVGVGTVVVTTNISTTNTPFTVDAPPPPTITLVSPLSGSVGTAVTITGTALNGATVTIGGAAATISGTPTATSITTSVPSTATVAVGSVVVTTSGGTAMSPFTVTAPPVGDVSIEGITLPNPSKNAPPAAPPSHAGLNGAGSEVNAYAMNPARCSTTPALTRSWQHNIDLNDYKSKNAFDFFAMNGGEALSYKFTMSTIPQSGGFIYNDGANAVVRPVFMSVTTTPCNFDTSKLEPGPNRDLCFQTSLNGLGMNWINISTGDFPAYCRLVQGQTYYLNLRFQDARPPSQGGTLPLTDSCTSGNCGGILQIL